MSIESPWSVSFKMIADDEAEAIAKAYSECDYYVIGDPEVTRLDDIAPGVLFWSVRFPIQPPVGIHIKVKRKRTPGQA